MVMWEASNGFLPQEVLQPSLLYLCGSCSATELPLSPGHHFPALARSFPNSHLIFPCLAPAVRTVS